MSAEDCPECGKLDALDRHSATCQRARTLGLQRLAEGEAPLPGESLPSEPPAEEPPTARPASPRLVAPEPRLFFVVEEDQRVLDGVVWVDGQVVVQRRAVGGHDSSLSVYRSFEVFMASDDLGEVEWADERVARAVAALQAAVGKAT